MTKAAWLTEEQESAWRSLQFMQMRLEAEIARQLSRESGLSYSEYLVLLTLTDQQEGRLRPFEVERMLGWEKSRLSHQVTRMEKRGLVEKTRCGDDRRGAYIQVTNKGRSEIERAAPGHVATVRRYFVDVLTPRELEALGAAAETVLAKLTEAQPASKHRGSEAE